VAAPETGERSWISSQSTAWAASTVQGFFTAIPIAASSWSVDQLSECFEMLLDDVVEDGPRRCGCTSAASGWVVGRQGSGPPVEDQPMNRAHQPQRQRLGRRVVGVIRKQRTEWPRTLARSRCLREQIRVKR